MGRKVISVIKALDYDLIMIANRITDRGESLMANEYLEALGGKGANSDIATFRTCHKKPKNLHDVATVDVLEELPPDDPIEQPPASIAAANDELEIEVRMIGAVGDDKYGERFLRRANGEVRSFLVCSSSFVR